MTKKYVLITGASSGLGKETALKLALDGYKVFAGVRKSEDAQKLENLNQNIKAVFLDVTNDASVENAFEAISKDTNTLFALINNAGIALGGPVEFLPISMLEKQFNVNVFGAIRTAQKFLPMLNNNNDSRIINITQLFHQEERFCNGKERESFEYVESLPDIDYTRENKEFEALKEKSIAFLKENLG